MEDALKYGEVWAVTFAVDKLREKNKNVVFGSEFTKVADERIESERTKTKEKLIAEVMNAENELTKTVVNKVRQAAEDVVMKNNGEHFNSEDDAVEAMRKELALEASSSSRPYVEDDNCPDILQFAKDSICTALGWDMRERMKVQLLGKDWETQVRQAEEANLENWNKKRDETLALSAGTDLWVIWKMQAKMEALGKKLENVMMDMMKLVFKAMSEK
ncbi:hypothetical protein [Candidatus Endomicrobiellum pyrsonymphae]|uniref:hypothetical protein n=1 Tax=Candidatus Endomicrobiellum pyrsonymphae TaxID=1408203 RepID=UPI0035A8F91F